MFKKIIAFAVFILTLACGTAFAEYDGYIVEIAENTPRQIELFSVENTKSATKVIDNMYLVDTLEEAQNFVEEKYIVKIIPNILFELYDTDSPNDKYYPNQWSLTNTNVPFAWKAGLSGDGVKIAIIDSGIAEHEDLNSEKIVYRYNAIENAADTSDVTDTYGHGTAVAGIIAAKTNNDIGIASVAENAELAIIKITENKTFGLNRIITALDKTVEQNCDIVNLSLGSSALTSSQIQYLKDEFARAVAASRKNGKDLIIIAAAGNEGNSSVSYPAGLDSVIGVGSVDRYNVRSSFSQYNSSVDIVAPGGTGNKTTAATQFDHIIILNHDPNIKYSLGDGTSYATPFVTGVVALAVEAAHKSNKPVTRETFLGTADQKGLLERSATDAGIPGRDDEYGWGIINAEKLVRALYEDGYIFELPEYPDNPDDTPRPVTPPFEGNFGKIGFGIKYSAENLPETITCNIPYTGETYSGIRFIGALYDKDNRLVKTTIFAKTELDEEDTAPLEFDVTNIGDVIYKPCVYKLFVWWGGYESNMEPLPVIIRLGLNQDQVDDNIPRRR